MYMCNLEEGDNEHVEEKPSFYKPGFIDAGDSQEG
jgi:hypothetical protein